MTWGSSNFWGSSFKTLVDKSCKNFKIAKINEQKKLDHDNEKIRIYNNMVWLSLHPMSSGQSCQSCQPYSVFKHMEVRKYYFGSSIPKISEIRQISAKYSVVSIKRTGCNKQTGGKILPK